MDPFCHKHCRPLSHTVHLFLQVSEFIMKAAFFIIICFSDIKHAIILSARNSNNM